MPAWHDVVGGIGVALVLLTYLLLQAGRMQIGRPAYPALNALGSGLIVLSLLQQFNFAAFAVEAAWTAISLYGLWRVLRRRQRPPAA